MKSIPSVLLSWSIVTSCASMGWCQVSATLDDASFIVLHAQGEQLAGVDILSPGGGLVPIPPGDFTAPATPFTFLLSNTENQVTYGNLGANFELDGSVKLGVAWNSLLNIRDVEMQWGNGATPETVFLPETFYTAGGPCEVCPLPPLGVSVNADRRVVLSGIGQEVTEMGLTSASNSLVPAATPAPFAQASVNTASEIQLASPGSNVTIDGDVELNVGWNDELYERDIRYSYSLSGGQSVGPKTIPKQDYDFVLPQFPQIFVDIDDESDHIVIQGSGQPLTEFNLISTTSSLIPGDDPGPFGSMETNTPTRIAYQPAGNVLTLDGTVTLAAKWDWQNPRRNITVEYDLLGDIKDERYTLPGNRYPHVPIPGEEPLLITLDENNNFVVTGIGQEVVGLEFTSESGALTLSEENTAPFPFLLSNKPTEVTMGVLGTVVMDGSYVMDFGPISPDRLDEIDIRVGFGNQAVSNAVNVLCNRCDLPMVSVSEDRGLVLSDFPEPITELRFLSENGALSPFDLPAEVTAKIATSTEMLLASETGFDAGILEGIAVAWGASQDAAVFVYFTLADGTSFGPLPLSIPTPAVPEPTSWCLLIAGGLLTLRWRRRQS